MHYCAIKECDIANGIGVRVTLFVSGCRNRCEGCFQPETWSFTYGNEFTEDTQKEIFEMLKPSYIRGLTVLGGDPMEPENQKALLPFLQKYKKEFPNKDLWLFTGYRYHDELTVPGVHPNCEYTSDILDLVDVMVDGRFELSLKNLCLKYRGSSNQRIIDMRRTRSSESGEVILWDERQASE